MVATGNEDLVATQAIATITGGLGAGANVGQRRASMGLGQGHGAEEAAFDHRLQKQALLLVSAEALDQVGRAHGQERVGGSPGVGGLEVSKACLRKQGRQLHAASFEVAAGVEKAGL
ncbi:hypothetical protein D3C78_1310260 [compost metagenome]